MEIQGIVAKGHRVASGLATDSPYDRGTIEMQIPYFQKLGLDLSAYYPGTLNLNISPLTAELKQPEYTFRQVKWHPDYPAEDFSFSTCVARWKEVDYPGWIYYTHPATKIGHFHDRSTLEVIAPPIPRIHYGDRVQLQINPMAISIS
jgi:hypothetical protein